MNTPSKWASTAILLILCVPVFGQSSSRKLGMEEAVELALKHNLQLQANQFTIASAEALTTSGYELPSTAFLFQYGQLNSLQQDNYFLIEQAIPWPGYFSARSKMFEAQVKSHELVYARNTLDIKTTVRMTYDRLQYLQMVQNELASLDTLYRNMAQIATVRYNAGDGTLVEKTASEMKASEISLLLSRYRNDYLAAYVTLKTWMGLEEDYMVEMDETYALLKPNMLFDSTALTNHPQLLALRQQVVAAEAELKLQHKANAPDLQVGYFNQSIMGVQNVDGIEVDYDGSKRFQGFNVGMRVPIFYTGNKAKIASLEARQLATEKEAEYTWEKMKLEFYTTYHQSRQGYLELEHYEGVALPHAGQLLQSAKNGYTSGEYGYLDYLQALQFVADTRLQYLETIHRLNQNNIHLQYLIQQ